MLFIVDVAINRILWAEVSRGMLMELKVSFDFILLPAS